jgi:hypothetical protein
MGSVGAVGKEQETEKECLSAPLDPHIFIPVAIAINKFADN